VLHQRCSNGFGVDDQNLDRSIPWYLSLPQSAISGCSFDATHSLLLVLLPKTPKPLSNWAYDSFM
jgi:hypothetical protein